ncbi:helix-turn-helix transcriptional regulator [Comamonas sp.]|uniref:helix-turn-helix transcriptional regulator n=1 Tax=Comamonas sp. TaxID=34028 RepID=UPI002FC6A35C
MEAELEALRNQVNALTNAVTLMARVKGERLTTIQVEERIGRTRQTIMKMVRHGDFPEPCTDGRWLLSDILEYESAKKH